MDRVVAVRERLDVARSVALKALEAGPPCADCRFRTVFGMCSSPAYAKPSFDPVSSRYSEAFETNVSLARGADGLCGPEALLFEPLTSPVVAAKAAWLGAKLVWFGAIALVFAVFLLSR